MYSKTTSFIKSFVFLMMPNTFSKLSGCIAKTKCFFIMANTKISLHFLHMKDKIMKDFLSKIVL